MKHKLSCNIIKFTRYQNHHPGHHFRQIHLCWLRPLLGSKSVTTKSKSESSRETFLKRKTEYEKLKLHIFKTITQQSPRKGLFKPSNEQFPSVGTTKPALSDPSQKLDDPSPTFQTASWIIRLQLAQRRVGSVLFKFAFVKLDQSRTMHFNLRNFPLRASVKLSLVSSQSELPLKLYRKKNKDLFSRIKFGSIVKRR